MKANELHEHLINNHVIGSHGKITFTLSNTTIPIKDISVVGNIVQEWLGHYMEDHRIAYRTKPNTQDFPDFLLNPNDDKCDLLEVKVFTKSPNFDVANFSAYVRSLRDHPYRLDANYLIFEYEVNEDSGVICIKDIWLKNVWEICGSSERSEVKIQWKQNDPVNIRPATWYSAKVKFKPFNSKLEFIEALYKVMRQARLDQSITNNWLNHVKGEYKRCTGHDIT